MDSKKIKIYLFICLFLSSCVSKEREIWYFIPESYEGFVNIKFDRKESKNKMLKFDDKKYVFFITGNPLNYKVCSPAYPSGYYVEKHFYYSKDTVYQISTNGMGWDLPRYPIVSNAGSYGNARGAYFFVAKDSLSKLKYDSLKLKSVKITQDLFGH